MWEIGLIAFVIASLIRFLIAPIYKSVLDSKNSKLKPNKLLNTPLGN